ncbi:hypothetical protein DERP_011661, partial [Dermatophagoides pteronyssinus]
MKSDEEQNQTLSPDEKKSTKDNIRENKSFHPGFHHGIYSGKERWLGWL